MNLIKQMDKNNLNFLNFNEVVKVLCQINGVSESEIKEELNSLIKKGLIINTSKKKIATRTKMGIFEGKITITKGGYGFFICEDKNQKDIFISQKNLLDAMNGDTVLVQKNYKTNEDSPEGKVVEILSRGLNVVVGNVESDTKNFAMINPLSNKVGKIFVKKSPDFVAKKGDRVVVKIIKHSAKMPEGKIIEVLMSNNPINLDVLSICREFELYEEFPKEVLISCEKFEDVVSEKDIEKREDYRNKLTFTIDGEDARDFDDAVSIEKLENGNVLLGVHIADVGHYVQKDGTIDAEAFKRGTSTYFPNAVFPMLPRKLSNGICSLNEGVDRLTLSCVMEVNNMGEVVNHKICESVINSKARMTYTNVAKILDGDEELSKKYDFLIESLSLMKKLALTLEKIRKERGALNFEIPEPKIILNENLEIVKFEKRPNTMADRIIESFMLLANETVAKEFCTKKIPFVYRVHEKPDTEKLEAFNDFASGVGFRLSGDLNNLSSKQLADFLQSIPEDKKTVVNKVLLRSMQKAKYKSLCLGHYGLGAKYYCHFTSPIRRYPDLTIHRIIKEYLHGDLSKKKIKEMSDFVNKSAEQSSVRETISDKAEIMVDEYFKARFMASKVGEIFDGIISGVTERGIYVELENTCEGFIHVEDLVGDGYDFIERKFTLTNKITKYTIGDKITIKVANANIESRKIDFLLANKK